MEQRDHVRNSRGATPNRQLKNGDDADFRESEDDIFSQETEEGIVLLNEENINSTPYTEMGSVSHKRPQRKCTKSFKKQVILSPLSGSVSESESFEDESQEYCPEDSESDSAPLVTFREDRSSTIRVGSIIYRLVNKIVDWLPILERINTQYIPHGSFLDPDRFARWSSLSDAEKQDTAELFLVRWRDLSYLHCSWESEEALLAYEGPHAKQKFHRFFRSEHDILIETTAYGEDVYFNPEHVEVDRILDARIVSDAPIDNKKARVDPDFNAIADRSHLRPCGMFSKEFLVKWRGSPYSDITWEVFDDFRNEEAVQEYYRHLDRVVDPQAHDPSERPSLVQFQKLDADESLTKGNQLRSYQIE